MFEQFRVLSAALRLDSFTAAQLAQESGVGIGTVQKTLARLKPLFPSEKPKVASRRRRGGQCLLYRLDKEGAKPLLQREADQLDLPNPPKGPHEVSFGLALAQHTLIQVFPRAEIAEQRNILNAAGSHLLLASETYNSDLYYDLRRLHTALTRLVATRDWLDSVRLSSRKAYQDLAAALRMVLSGPAANDSVTMTNEIIDQVFGFEINLAEVLGLSEQAPFNLRPSELYESYWLLISHPMWASKIGDFTNPSSLSRAAARLRPSERVVFGPPAVLRTADDYAREEVRFTPGTIFSGARMPRYEGFEALKRARLRPLDAWYEWYQGYDKPRSSIQIFCMNNNKFELKEYVHGGVDNARAAVLGEIFAFNVDLANHSVDQVTVRALRSLSAILPFKDLEYDNSGFGDRPLPSFRSAKGLRGSILPSASELLVFKQAAAQWIEPEIIRFAFAKENRFEVHAPHPEFVGYMMEHNQKIGELVDIEFNFLSGRSTRCHVRIDASLTTVVTDAASLEFLPEEQIFVIRTGTEAPNPYSPTTANLRGRIGWVRNPLIDKGKLAQ